MIRKAVIDDSRTLAEMAVQMWDSHTVAELDTEFSEMLNNEHSAFFVKYVKEIPVGFAQCGLRTLKADDTICLLKSHRHMKIETIYIV